MKACILLTGATGAVGSALLPELLDLGFIIYCIAAVAEVNRLPFDLPEAETELVAGYQTEYSSLKFALFYMAEYINMLTVSAIASTLFLGGYQGPFGLFPGVHWLLIKIGFFSFDNLQLTGKVVAKCVKFFFFSLNQLQLLSHLLQ